jgi:uncharacterized protein YecT (DUF1311 family)
MSRLLSEVSDTNQGDVTHGSKELSDADAQKKVDEWASGNGSLRVVRVVDEPQYSGAEAELDFKGFRTTDGEMLNGRGGASFIRDTHQRWSLVRVQIGFHRWTVTEVAKSALKIQAKLASPPVVTPDKPKQTEPAWERPGTKEAASVEEANREINVIYEKLLATLDQGKQERLRHAQRAWLTSRDAEAERVAREGGATGGSAFRVDFLSAQETLTRQRSVVLKDYLNNPEKIP